MATKTARPKVYLAGPEVFLRNAVETGVAKVEICARYGLEGKYPLDAQLDLEFARVVAATVGYTGEISYDRSKPDGTPQKLLDVGRLARLGWRARTSLEDGIRLAYRAYLSEQKQAAE